MRTSFLTDGNFWTQTAERAIKTVAQAGIGYFTSDALLTDNGINFAFLATVASIAGVVSILTSIVSAPTGEDNSPSLVAIESTADNRVI